MTATRVGSARVCAAMIAAAWTIGCGRGVAPGPVVHEHHAIERGAATSARVEIEMSGGELDVKSGASTLFAGDFDYNIPALKPAITYGVEGGTGALKVSQGSASGHYENKWQLSLDETTPVDLHVILGKGDVQLALGRLTLQSLAVRLGAGDLVVDLRGKPGRSYSVKVQAGAGDTTIYLPASVAVSARTSGLIGDASVSGLEKRDGRWINPRAAASAITVDLQVQHAIGDLKLVAE